MLTLPKVMYIAAASLFLSVCSAAYAAILDPRGILIDQGASTFDRQSGRYWLDLSSTTGLSYNDMKLSFGCDPKCTGGRLAGWTFAQAGDVRELVEDAALSYGTDLFVPGDAFFANIDRLNVLISMLGQPISFDDGPCAQGCGGVSGILNRILTEDDLSGNRTYPADLFAGFVQQASIANISCCGDRWAGDNLSGPENMAPYPVGPIARDVGASNGGDFFFTNGVWLYRVPEPVTLALIGLGLLGMVAGRSGRSRCVIGEHR